MITMTVRALEKVKEFAESSAMQERGLRARVIGGGCSGFTYALEFEDAPGVLDETFACGDVALYVDPLSLQYLDGSEIDFEETQSGAGFKFKNPNVKGSCGCGSSFSV